MPAQTFHLIPHTHWDREWYLPQAAFLSRMVPALDELFERLESDPEFRSFLLDGQTVLLEDYLRVRPDELSRVRELVRSGRLQIGPWYVLADEQIPSGESLIRNLLLGASDCARLGGRLDVLYSPDAFGHPAIWPTLAAEFGIGWGVLWRGLGGEAGQERDLYRWRGPDGQDVLLYHLPPEGYEIGSALTPDPEQLPAVWPRIRDVLRSRAATRHIAVFVGADHHAAPLAIGRVRSLLAALDPEHEFRVSRLDEFFAQVASAAAQLPCLEGELRWSYRYTWTLQSVHATRAPLKRRHSECELWLSRVAEPLAALAPGDRTGAVPLLQHAWRALVRSEFHDSLGGCTSDEVARRAEQRILEAEAIARETARSSLHALVGHDPDRMRDEPGLARPRLVLWNPAPRRREMVVTANLTWFRRDVLVGPPGGRVPRQGQGYVASALAGSAGPIALQVLGQAVAHERLDALRHYPDQDEVDLVRVAFMAPAVPGFGTCVLKPEPATLSNPGARAHPGTAWARGRRLGNGLLEVTVERGGALSLLDRRTGERYDGVLVLESAGDVGDTYSYCPPARDRPRRSGGGVRVQRLAAGPLVAAVEVRWWFESVLVRSVVSLHASSPVVRCTLQLENQATDRRLRARVSTGVTGEDAVAGAQFGPITRSVVRATPADYPLETPVATAPAHRFVAVARDRHGLAILAPGFFEYELEERGDLLVTLLRSVGQLSRGNLRTRPGHAGWPTATPEAQCLGEDTIRLAIAPVSAAQVRSGTELPELWEDVFLPVRGIWLRQGGPLEPKAAELALEGDGLVFSALKPAAAGGGIVLRCYNATGTATRGAWRFGKPISIAHRLRADESVLGELDLEDSGRTVRFTAAPHEVVTIGVDWNPSAPTTPP